jgi:hypothetical protein
LAYADNMHRLDLRQQQEGGTYSMQLVEEWWQGLSKKDKDDFTKGDKSKGAAVALFTNPPVTFTEGCLRPACMVIRCGTTYWIHRPKEGGYPELILQHEKKNQRRQVCVPAHVVVAWVFHGAPPDDQKFVCHHDEPPTRVDEEGQVVLGYPSTLQWASHELMLPQLVGTQHYPGYGRCNSKDCVSPLCLHYSTKEENCRTAHTSHRAATRKAKMKFNRAGG